MGQSCLAIGNPYGYERTLTTGVVSGLGREIPSPNGSSIRGAVQTDAAINAGIFLFCRLIIYGTMLSKPVIIYKQCPRQLGWASG